MSVMQYMDQTKTFFPAATFNVSPSSFQVLDSACHMIIALMNCALVISVLCRTVRCLRWYFDPILFTHFCNATLLSSLLPR